MHRALSELRGDMASAPPPSSGPADYAGANPPYTVWSYPRIVGRVRRTCAGDPPPHWSPRPELLAERNCPGCWSGYFEGADQLLRVFHKGAEDIPALLFGG
jgi:hypothetical protein